ncbi:ATP-binding protein [Paenibacillus mendelii]|uniref:DNA topoisomerase (ATP-hydrolyzing) n=1 Tax=Paenibacillus mendelii TaxID=206163 RepID=A0ABV6J4L9_9BACL|nr:ATP-binding protein [Paenibacillus mendelii]MCQ6561966.1 ATP-binding protein [Paenibacillus mendelii]
MTASRDFAAELDTMKTQLSELTQQVRLLIGEAGSTTVHTEAAIHPEVPASHAPTEAAESMASAGELYFSGYYNHDNTRFRWEPKSRSVSQILAADGDKAAKVIGALGHKQRLDIIRTVLYQPMNGAELVERLNMGTTGQLYHHLKALLGADLLQQDDRGGRYSIPRHRTLPLLLLLAATSDLLDTSDYLDMTEARGNAAAYLGKPEGKHDPHALLGAVLENSILEHQAGYCTEVNIYVHDNRRVTVADNGRGIPTRAFPGTETDRSWLQTVMTDLHNRTAIGASYSVPGGEKGISIAVVNALSLHLQVETRRDGSINRQDYSHGIPRCALTPVGTTGETGISVTFEPDPELFHASFDRATIETMRAERSVLYPGLTLRVHA